MLEDDFRLHWNRLAVEQPVTLLLSGGGDSVALFHLLLGADLEFDALHFQHDSPGDFSVRSAEFCRKLCHQHQVNLRLEEILGRGLMKNGDLSWEAACRHLRYEFVSHQDGVFLTAHTQDDQAETVVLKLLGGAGLSGLAGVRTNRGNVLRPLLPYSRMDLRHYLKDKGLAFLDDPTNIDGNDRARIRNTVLPILKEFNPGLGRTLARTAERLSGDDECLTDMMTDWLNSKTLDGGDHWKLEDVRDLHRSLQWRLLKRAWRVLGSPAFRPRGTLFEECLRIFESGSNESRVTFPGGWGVRILGDKVWVHPALSKWEYKGGELPPFLEVDVSYMDELRDQGLVLRTRQAGDRFKGRCVKKELAQKTGQPPWVRDQWPLLERRGEIVGIWGIYKGAEQKMFAGLRFFPHRLRGNVLPNR